MEAISSTLPVYAVGYESGGAMVYGPTFSLDDMLDVFAGDEGLVLWRFNPDNTEDVLYRWRKGRWEEEQRV